MYLSFEPTTHTYTVDGRKVPSVTEICERITALKYQSGGVLLEQAKMRGTRVHELCELLNLGEDLSAELVEPELAGYINAYMRFLRDWRPKVIYTEHRLYNSEFEYAGTCDLVAEIDGKQAVIDIKTTSSMDRASRISVAAQLAAYRMALSIPNMRRLCVSLKRDGSYTVIDAADIESKYGFDGGLLFLQLLELYHTIEGDLKDARTDRI